MLGVTYGHGILRDYVVAFGTIFNDISVIRTGAGLTTRYIRVPLSYAPQERFLARLNQDPNLSRQPAVVLPRMSFEMTTMNYAGERKLSSINRLRKMGATSNTVYSVFTPVPYDIGFSVHIYTRNTEDASNIVEQILPFFTPEFTLTIKKMTDLELQSDTPIILNGISKEDNYEGGFDDRRTLIWTLDFTLKGVLYGPISSSSGLIKKAYIEFYTPSQYSVEVGTARSANNLALNQIRLAANASTVGKFYDGATINVISGTAAGTDGLQRYVTQYVGSTQLANVSPAFVAPPDATSIYQLSFTIPDAEYDAGDVARGTRNAAKLASRVYLQAGLTANGLPTTNSYFSVNVNQIDANDDYGVIETTTFFDTGVRRNLLTGKDEF